VQLHNPYLATPLSIASYRMATSPSDQNNQNVIDWLDRLTSSYQSTVKAAGGTVGSKAFTMESRIKGSQMKDSDFGSDAEEQTATVHGGKHRVTVGDDEGASAGLTGREGGSSGGSDEVDKTSALPDAAVPLGLIAKLSLSNRTKGRRRSRYGDDDVVSSILFDDWPSFHKSQLRVSRMKGTSNLVCIADSFIDHFPF
jgi:hypothetical protein